MTYESSFSHDFIFIFSGIVVIEIILIEDQDPTNKHQREVIFVFVLHGIPHKLEQYVLLSYGNMCET